MFTQEVESIPFRQPVDPNTLNIPDYFDIIRKPMDLSTIHKKLTTGQYSDPWEYVDDVWLMFDNAWLYNRKTSRVYRYCTKVSEKINLFSFAFEHFYPNSFFRSSVFQLKFQRLSPKCQSPYLFHFSTNNSNEKMNSDNFSCRRFSSKLLIQ